MQSIDITELEKFGDNLNALLDKIPNSRRELHERLAQATKQEVNAQISASGVNDSGGRVKSWQESHVGSGGGYAAVRATDSSISDNSSAAVTNYLESGHKVRRPSGKSKRYRPKIKVPYVNGHHFYQNARVAMETKAISISEEYADNIAKELSGE